MGKEKNLIIKGKGFNGVGKINLIINSNGEGKEYYYNNTIKYEGEY